MKVLKLILTLVLTFVGLVGLSSCGGFVVEDESIIITEVYYSEADEEGNVVLTIVYELDGEEKYLEHTIPVGEKGDTGKDGNGIKGITYTSNEDGSKTICTITFTDESVKPANVELPNGASIASVISSPDDETGGTVVTFVLDDGTKLDSLLIPAGQNGEDGKDGVGIKSITPEIDPETGDTILTITMDDEEETKSVVTIRKGSDGRGITTIVGTESDDKYYLTIYYSDNENETVEFNKPVPNAWYQGQTSPDPSLGINGDYYFDVSNKNIYSKYNDIWNLIVSFNSQKKQYSVSFDANGGTIVGYSSYKVENGMNFNASGYTMPSAVRDGYTFAGWYCVKNPTIVNGMFTDLTTVCENLTLYAYWEPNN